jgi:phosphoglycerol geranylgeranyltransferase
MNMKIIDYIHQKLKTEKMHMTLIDPDKQKSEQSKRLAELAQKIGTDAIMIGGSTGVTLNKLDATVKAIKEGTDLPVILFPANSRALSKWVDAIYFMSMLNSRNIKNIIGEHIKAAPIIKKLGIETISMGYVVVEPGMKVGQVGEADLISRDNIREAVGYALSAQFLGMKLFYLEAGSGADLPVSEEMISAVRKEINIPLIVGGGIQHAYEAKASIDAGADIIVTGTAIENRNKKLILQEIVDAVKMQ